MPPAAEGGAREGRAMTELPLRTVGQPARRTDAEDKVSGNAVYTADVSLPECCTPRCYAARTVTRGSGR